jgi:hypothetical protein
MRAIVVAVALLGLLAVTCAEVRPYIPDDVVY